MILGLDLGQTIGWCLGNAVGPLRHGEFPLKNTTDLGLWLRSSDDFFIPMFRDGGVTGVAIEQPFLSPGGKKADGSSKPGGYYPARKLLSLLGHAYMWGSFYGLSDIHFEEVPVASAKLTLSGSGAADKDQMIAAAAARGYPSITGEHEADALGIWWCYVFGRAEPIAKRRSKSSKAVVIKP